MRYKVLAEWFEEDPDTGLFIRYADINPVEGGKSIIIKLSVDVGVPVGMHNGYQKVKEENGNTN